MGIERLLINLTGILLGMSLGIALIISIGTLVQAVRAADYPKILPSLAWTLLSLAAMTALLLVLISGRG